MRILIETLPCLATVFAIVAPLTLGPWLILRRIDGPAFPWLHEPPVPVPGENDQQPIGGGITGRGLDS